MEHSVNMATLEWIVPSVWTASAMQTTPVNTDATLCIMANTATSNVRTTAGMLCVTQTPVSVALVAMRVTSESTATKLVVAGTRDVTRTPAFVIWYATITRLIAIMMMSCVTA
jgi:hypothetical protein